MSQRAATERLNPARGRVGHMSRKRRLTNYAVSLMICCTASLCLTGCALYYVVSDRWRSWTAILHW